MCHIWISCEGSEANIFFGFLSINFGIFWSKMVFCHSLLNLFKEGRGYWQNVYLCVLFFNILVKGGLLVIFLKKFCEGGVRLRFLLPCKSECQPIFQNSIRIFQNNFLFLFQGFQKYIALVYCLKMDWSYMFLKS